MTDINKRAISYWTSGWTLLALISKELAKIQDGEDHGNTVTLPAAQLGCQQVLLLRKKSN
jgi:hypothetical protein